MIEINYSYIWSNPINGQGDPFTQGLVDDFIKQYGVKVLPHWATWDNAWPELFGFALKREGPHVSHVGNTWVSSLAEMNALRPFKPGEVDAMGGPSAFIPANWESSKLVDDERIWGIPLAAHHYTICYRKDLFAKAGINSETPFDANNRNKTFEQLAASDLEIPWLTYGPASPRDLLHIATSWIWAAGGELLNREGTQVLFNSPQAIEGLKDWLATYRAVPETCRQLSGSEASAVFSDGKAAALLTYIGLANNIVRTNTAADFQANLAFAPVTEVPWVGGQCLVIWDHVSTGSWKQEQAAVDFVKFMTSKEIAMRFPMSCRMDVIKECHPEGSPLHGVVMQIARNGRGYPSHPIWRRIETQLSDTLNLILKELFNEPDADPEKILHSHLDPLAERLNLTLEK